MKGRGTLLVIAFLLLTLLPPLVAADTHLPVGLLKAQEDNKVLAGEFLLKLSFFMAFLAGIVSILSPCVLPLIPAYFAITFKERKHITLATLIFFLGFTSVFIVMGLLAALTGKILIQVFSDVSLLIPAAGAFFIFFGVMLILGKGFSGTNIGVTKRTDWIGVFLSGGAFAIGWTACIGPILSGVVLMTSVFNNYVSASLLMFAYSLGIFVPLFLLSFFYDRRHMERMTWFSKQITFGFFKKTFNSSWPNIIAGSLFIILGTVFVVFNGTAIVNGLQLFGLKPYFYSLQRYFLDNAATMNIVGGIVFVVFIFLLSYHLWQEYTGGKK